MLHRFLVGLIFLCINMALANQTHEKIEELDKKNKALFAEVKVFTDKLLEDERNELKYYDVDASISSLQNSLNHAYDMAELNGLHVEKLKALYELSKKVILNSDFITADSKAAPSAGNSFSEWFDFVGVTHEALQREKAKAQQMRVAFFKKATIRYIEALSEKDATKAYESFKSYVDAIRTIQSADAQQFLAQGEALVAEQKLVAEIASGIPGVGDAMDIVSFVLKEDLSGEKLSEFDRAFTLIALLTPEVLEQTIKRSPRFTQAIAKIGALAGELGDEVLSKVSKNKYNSKIELENYLATLDGPSDEIKKWREFYHQKIKELRSLDALDEATKLAKANEIEAQMSHIYTRETPLSEALSQEISSVAQKRDEIIFTRDVNEMMETHLLDGAHTKSMFVKGKSASEGIAKGFIPTNQRFSKLTNAQEIETFQRKVNNSLVDTTENVNGVQKFTPQTSKTRQLILKRGEETFEGVEIPKLNSQESIAVYKRSDGVLVDEHLNPLSEDVITTLDKTNEKPFEVLTDMQGNYLTADIDLLAVGSKKKNTILQNDHLMGNINSNEMATVADINHATKNPNDVEQILVHHGSENNFMSKSSRPDFPTTAYMPDGKIAVIQNERELKDFFHAQKLKGYDLQPNPYWEWGEYNAQKGYK